MKALNDEPKEYPPFCRPKFTVLVEEDPVIRTLWAEYYQQKAWPLEVFDNPLEFLEQLDRFSRRDEKMYFFFDQDHGYIRGVGVQLARAVLGLNRYQTVSLVTNHFPFLFEKEQRERLINYVFDKYPEAVFGKNYYENWLESHSREAIQKLPHSWRRCALERALNFDGYHLDFTLEEHFPSRAPKAEVEPEAVPAPQEPKQIVLRASKTPWWKRVFFTDQVKV